MIKRKKEGMFLRILEVFPSVSQTGLHFMNTTWLRILRRNVKLKLQYFECRNKAIRCIYTFSFYIHWDFHYVLWNIFRLQFITLIEIFDKKSIEGNNISWKQKLISIPKLKEVFTVKQLQTNRVLLLFQSALLKSCFLVININLS